MAPLLKRLEKAGYINRARLENNENRLLLSLTAEGERLKERALGIPARMRGCVPLTQDELLLKELLTCALAGMEAT